MDNSTKILIGVLVLLGAFGLFRLFSSDDKPDWDKQRAEKIAQAKSTQNVQESQERAAARAKAVEAARALRPERPQEKLATLETDVFKATFTTRGGALKSYLLKNEQFKEAPRNWTTGLREEEAEFVPVDLVTTNSSEFELTNPLRFEITQGLNGFLPDADFEIIESSPTRVIMENRQQGVSIRKKFEISGDSGPYTMWMTVKVANHTDSKVTFLPSIIQTGYQHESEAEGGMFSRQPNLQNGICASGGEIFRQPWNSDETAVGYNGISGVKYTGVETNYFLAALIPGDDIPTSCYVHRNQSYNWTGSAPVVTAELRFGEVDLAPGASRVFKVKNFLGPKQFKLLRSLGNDLQSSVDFGWFGMLSKPILWLLFLFQKLVLNWGIAIILLTVSLKVLLMPLTHKSFKSSDRMKALKPEVDKLNEKFKDDPQEKQKAVMALYKQHKINPLGGCLPMLLQMPIWFALFSTLRATPELYRAPFFGWITDLSSPDPYFVTPVVMGALMFVQQRLMPMGTDNAQAKMMLYFMPIMFTAMMLFLPSGLTLYILVNTVLSIVHQTVIHKQRQKAANA